MDVNEFDTRFNSYVYKITDIVLNVINGYIFIIKFDLQFWNDRFIYINYLILSKVLSGIHENNC